MSPCGRDRRAMTTPSKADERLGQRIVGACDHTALPDVGEIRGACDLCIAAALAKQGREIERLKKYECPISGHDAAVPITPEGVGNPRTPILCPHCAGELQVGLDTLRLDMEAERDRGDGWKLQCQSAEVERNTLRAQRDALVEALEKCDGNRGCFSTVEPHDLRCPKSRAESPETWKGDWRCECGRDELDAALAAAREQ